MSVLLLVLGILVTGAGVAAIGFGIPNNEFGIGNTLIVAGTTAVAGGLLLIGLAAAVGQLTRIAEALRSRPVPRPATRAAEPFAEAAAFEPPAPAFVPPPLEAAPEPPSREQAPAPRAPAAPSPVDASSSALERLRATMPRAEQQADEAPLSPNPPPRAPTPDLAPESAPAPRGMVVETLKKPRLDFLFRSKSAPPAGQAFDTVWPKRGPNAPDSPGPEAPTRRASGNGVSQPNFAPPGAPSRAGEPRPAAILKSGVVDGMAYTLYADGSIEAQLPQGTVRFGSIAELRAHIDNNS